MDNNAEQRAAVEKHEDECWDAWKKDLQPTWEKLSRQKWRFAVQELYDPETGLPA